MITPILKDPKAHGGTLYTFPSASRDLTRTFSNSEYEFVFSHFACLNLPDFRYGDFKDGDIKGVYLDNLTKHYYSNADSDLISDSDSDSLLDLASKDLNTYLKWHIQSYVMNYEIAILNGYSLDSGKYDAEILRTPSERIFFNWLQKVGAIKFDGGSETLRGYGDDIGDEIVYETATSVEELDSKDRAKSYRIGNKLYTWKGGQWRSRVLVSKTVQYIGTIDMVNNVNIDFDSFNEIYLNIPAGVGGSEVVFDYNVYDSNYERGEIIDVSRDVYCDNTKFIIGRDPEKLNMSGDVTLEAIYDSKYDIYDNGWGFDSPTYKIDNGYCINFNEDQYKDANGALGIEKMNLGSNEDFEFNCVLIYYRIRKGNGRWYTNLYGVLFLEEATTSDYNTDSNIDDERVGYIQRYPKFKKGNSWGLKLDLKIDAQPDSQMELRDKLYDDPNDGNSMQMFMEALVHLNDCTKIFYEVKEENTQIEERLYKLENMVSGVDTVYDLRDEIGVLRTRVEMFQPTLNSLVGRMENVENKIGKLETNLGYLIQVLDNINGKNIDLDSRLTSLENSINDSTSDSDSDII
jgi:uncharacterized coiled-coil protein SlyX